MPDSINPALVLAHADAWLRTPYVPRGAVRSSGADCVGLLRGLHAELCGADVPAPPWAPGMAASSDMPIARELKARMVPTQADHWRLGDIVVLRIGSAAAAHVAIYAGGGYFVHSAEHLGVVKVPGLTKGRPATGTWGFPCPPGCHPGPPPLTPADCKAVVYPHGSGAYGEVIHAADGLPLARTAVLSSEAHVIDLLDPIYTHIETVR
ncbi:MAG: NlpC/P60 family protein [Pseudomonadota bacterium]